MERLPVVQPQRRDAAGGAAPAHLDSGGRRRGELRDEVPRLVGSVRGDQVHVQLVHARLGRPQREADDRRTRVLAQRQVARPGQPVGVLLGRLRDLVARPAGWDGEGREPGGCQQDHERDAGLQPHAVTQTTPRQHRQRDHRRDRRQLGLQHPAVRSRPEVRHVREFLQAACRAGGDDEQERRGPDERELLQHGPAVALAPPARGTVERHRDDRPGPHTRRPQVEHVDDDGPRAAGRCVPAGRQRGDRGQRQHGRGDAGRPLGHAVGAPRRPQGQHCTRLRSHTEQPRPAGGGQQVRPKRGRGRARGREQRLARDGGQTPERRHGDPPAEACRPPAQTGDRSQGGQRQQTERPQQPDVLHRARPRDQHATAGRGDGRLPGPAYLGADAEREAPRRVWPSTGETVRHSTS